MSGQEACGFCGLPRAKVRMLVCGIDGKSCICDECAILAVRMLVEHRPEQTTAIPLEVSEQLFVRSHDVSRNGGLVYVVATVPELDVRRIKVGFTSRPIENRIYAFKTANPTATLVGLWSAPSEAEDIAHRIIDGRLGRTEVFHVADVSAALAAIDAELTKRWP